MQPGATEKNAELIRQIKRLRDQGLLTDEQYRQQYRILTNQKKPSQRIASHRRLPLWVISAGVTAAAALILFSVTKNEPGESTSASTAEFAITTTSLAVTQTTSPQEVTPTTNLSERTAVPPQPPITYDLPTGYLVCSSKESARFMQEVLIKNGHQIVADGVCGTETDRKSVV